MLTKGGAMHRDCTSRQGRRGTARRPARGAPRGAALTALLTVLVVLLIAAEAQAYAPGHLIWAKRIGTSTSEAAAWSIARGPNGAVALAGRQYASPIGSAPMVAKYTAAGRKWVRTYPASGSASAVAFDRAGNVYVVASVNPGPGGDIVVIKYSAAGDWQWTTPPYDAPGYFAGRLAVDRSGDVIVVVPHPNQNATGTIFSLLKYDTNGALAWPAPVTYDPASIDPAAVTADPTDVTVDGDGDIYVSGYTTYIRDSHYVDSGLVLKFAGANGSRLSRFMDFTLGATESQFSDVVVRGSTVVAVGTTYDPADWNLREGLVAKFDLGLHPQYRKEWGGAGTRELFQQAVIDGKGNVYVTGKRLLVTGSGGYTKVVTLKLGPRLLKALWQVTYMPRSRFAQGQRIARDGAGNVYVSGVTTMGDYDKFLTIKYSPSGARRWLRTWSGGGVNASPGGLALGAKGDVFVAGTATAASGFEQAALLRYQR